MSNLIITIYIHRIIDDIPHHICYGMVHNQYTHIHFSGILYMSKFYHHNNILLYVSNQISYTPQSIMHYFNVQVKIFLDHFRKTGLTLYLKNHVLLITVDMSMITFSSTLKHICYHNDQWLINLVMSYVDCTLLLQEKPA